MDRIGCTGTVIAWHRRSCSEDSAGVSHEAFRLLLGPFAVHEAPAPIRGAAGVNRVRGMEVAGGGGCGERNRDRARQGDESPEHILERGQYLAERQRCRRLAWQRPAKIDMREYAHESPRPCVRPMQRVVSDQRGERPAARHVFSQAQSLEAVCVVQSPLGGLDDFPPK